MSSIVIALPQIEDAKKSVQFWNGMGLSLHLYVQLHQMLCQVRLNLEAVC